MPPRLAVLPDFPAEGWPSMDLCGEMLLAHLPTAGTHAVEPHRVCPPFVRFATRLPLVGKMNAAFNADRLLNRFVTFPRHARRVARSFDLFHVVDHTYAQLVHALPCDRTGVYCHDLDAFRCLLDPARDRRPWWFRKLARRILTGLQKAAVVFHSTRAVGDELKRLGLIDPAKLVHAPYGVSEEFSPHPTAPGEPMPWLEELTGRPWVLHVGSCIPRKRIDVLLDVVAELRRTQPGLTLVKVGGEWSAEHREQMARLNLQPAVVHVTGLSRERLAEVYRRAAVVLVPSEAEGFGLPVIEALACGSAVIASDLPVLREVGGEVTTYCAVGDVPAWAASVKTALTSQRDGWSPPPLPAGEGSSVERSENGGGGVVFSPHPTPAGELRSRGDPSPAERGGGEWSSGEAPGTHVPTTPTSLLEGEVANSSGVGGRGVIDSSARSARLAWAARYRWATHADTIAAAYHRVRKGEPPCGSCS